MLKRSHSIVEFTRAGDHRHEHGRGVPANKPDARVSYRGLSFEEDICIHIFSVSATLLGICLTVVGVVHNIVYSHHYATVVDDFLTVDSLFFLVACFMSYWAIRTRAIRRMKMIERIADISFLTGLIVLAMSCFFITYTFA